jgi:hypothetical protein
MSKDDAAIEQEIQAKGLNAPRLTPELIDATITGEYFFTAADGAHNAPLLPGMDTFTICVLVLRNGFIVTGESAPASPQNYDPELGRKIARQKAKDKIWAFEGYLLRDKLAA